MEERRDWPFIRRCSACTGEGMQLLVTVGVCHILVTSDDMSHCPWIPGAGNGDGWLLPACPKAALSTVGYVLSHHSRKHSWLGAHLQTQHLGAEAGGYL